MTFISSSPPAIHTYRHTQTHVCWSLHIGSEDNWLALAGWWGAMMQPLMHIIESFLSDLPLTLFIPSFLFFIFLPAACRRVFPCSSSHSFNSMIPLLKTCSVLTHPFLFFTPSSHFLCIWLTEGFVQLRGEHITPSQMGRRSERGLPPGVCTSDCALAVRQCSAMWTGSSRYLQSYPRVAHPLALQCAYATCD